MWVPPRFFLIDLPQNRAVFGVHTTQIAGWVTHPTLCRDWGVGCRHVTFTSSALQGGRFGGWSGDIFWAKTAINS